MGSKKVGPGDYLIGTDRAQRVALWIVRYLQVMHIPEIQDQTSLCAKARIKNQYFTDWLRGNANPKNARTMNREQVQKLAEALDMEESRLVGEAFLDLGLNLAPLLIVQASQ